MVAGESRSEPPTTQELSGGNSYAEVCAECHGATLGGGKGPPLRGAGFLQSWKDKPGSELYSRILTTMPASEPGTLPEETVLNITIYVLSQNGVDVSSRVKSPDLLGPITVHR